LIIDIHCWWDKRCWLLWKLISSQQTPLFWTSNCEFEFRSFKKTNLKYSFSFMLDLSSWVVWTARIVPKIRVLDQIIKLITNPNKRLKLTNSKFCYLVILGSGKLGTSLQMSDLKW
jgi:hypothetical protein